MKRANITLGWVSCLLVSVSVWAADGVLDVNFHAPDGYAMWDGGAGYDRGRAIALQPDGKIVVTGYMTNGVDDDLFVLRYDANGNLDTGFGFGGVFIYDSGQGNDSGHAIAVQPDDKILVAGAVANGVNGDAMVLRLNPEGTPDISFGSNGVFIYDGAQGNDAIIDVQIQANGNIIAVGSRSNGSDNDVLILCLTASGVLNTDFNSNGIALYDSGLGYDSGTRLALESDGDILVAGVTNNGSNYDILVARYNMNGVLDPNFGVAGIARYDQGDYDRGYGIDIDSQDNILVTGLSTQPDANSVDYDIALLRYDPNGVLDPTFGNNGVFFFDGGTREECYDLLVQCDDSVLVVGHSGESLPGISDWSLVVLKVDPNGVLNPTFGTQGVYTYDPTENTEWGYGLVLQEDGKIVVAGQAFNGIDDDVIVLRLENSLCDSNVPADTNNPMAYWPLDEESGTLAHDTIGDHDGTVHGGTWTEGVLNGALQLDGFDDYVDMGVNNILGPEFMTLSIWIRPNHMGGARYIANRSHTINDLTDYALLIHGARRIEFVFDERGAGSGSVTSTTQVALEEWTHIAVTRDQAEGILYINGVPDGSKPYQSRSTGDDFRMTISSRRGQSRFFHGKIDEVILYDRVFSEEQIAELAAVTQ